MNPSRIVSLLLSMFAFVSLTGARSCSGGVGASSGYAGGGVYVDGPGTAVVVDSPPLVIVDAPPVALVVGDVALTVLTPSGELPGTTQSFSLVVREDSAYGPVVLEGHDFVFDANGVGPVDITALPYGLYDLELTGYDAWGGISGVGAATVMLDESAAYVTIELEATAYAPAQGDVVLDLVAPDGGAFGPPIDTIDYYLWAYDPLTGAFTFVESVGYIPFDAFNPAVIPALGYGSYYVEVDAVEIGRAHV